MGSTRPTLYLWCFPVPFSLAEKAPVDVWLWVGIASTVLIVILLIFIGRFLIRRHRQVTSPRLPLLLPGTEN